MSVKRIALLASALIGATALAGCADDYGYGGVDVGYGAPGYYDNGYYDGGYGPDYGYGDGYYGGGYGGYFGWYNGFYYPGTGIYVYDQWRRPYRWNDGQRRYWNGRRGYWNGHNGGYHGSPQTNWNGFNRGSGTFHGNAGAGGATTQGFHNGGGNFHGGGGNFHGGGGSFHGGSGFHGSRHR